MRAMVFHGPGELRAEELPVPTPDAGQVLLRIDAALTCGTDVKTLRRGHPVMIPHVPTVFGHELAGTVAALGSGVRGIREGDRLVAANSAPCGECPSCVAARPNLCDDLLFVNGAYGEYIALPARLVTRNVVRLGTGASAIRVVAGLPYEVPAAGKTGTNNEGTDLWFAGFTPNLLATVWFGFDTPTPIYVGGTGTGGALAAPVWGNFMRRVYCGVEADEANGVAGVDPLLPIPETWAPHPGLVTVLVDRKTGLLASPWCPTEDQYPEYYIPGTEPTEPCDRTERRFQLGEFAHPADEAPGGARRRL